MQGSISYHFGSVELSAELRALVEERIGGNCGRNVKEGSTGGSTNATLFANSTCITIERKGSEAELAFITQVLHSLLEVYGMLIGEV